MVCGIAMNTQKGPAKFLTPFVRDAPPFNSFDSIGVWAGNVGYADARIPSRHKRLLDLKTAPGSEGYCDKAAGELKMDGAQTPELSAHSQPIALSTPGLVYEDLIDAGSERLETLWVDGRQNVAAANVDGRYGIAPARRINFAFSSP